MSRTPSTTYLGNTYDLPAPRIVTPETQGTPHPLDMPGIPLSDGRHLLTAAEAARWLGIPRDRLKEFVGIGLLHPIGSRYSHYDLAELEQLKVGLLAIVKPCLRHGCDGVIPRRNLSAGHFARQQYCSASCWRKVDRGWRYDR